MQLTPEEIERYAPYHTMRAFNDGFVDYQTRRPRKFRTQYENVEAQAYDRGAECAMRRQREADHA